MRKICNPYFDGWFAGENVKRRKIHEPDDHAAILVLMDNRYESKVITYEKQ